MCFRRCSSNRCFFLSFFHFERRLLDSPSHICCWLLICRNIPNLLYEISETDWVHGTLRFWRISSFSFSLRFYTPFPSHPTALQAIRMSMVCARGGWTGAELFICNIFFVIPSKWSLFFSRNDNSFFSSPILHQSIYIYKENLANTVSFDRSLGISKPFSALLNGSCFHWHEFFFFAVVPFARTLGRLECWCFLLRSCCFRWQSQLADTKWNAVLIVSFEYKFIKRFQRQMRERQRRTNRRIRIWNWRECERCDSTRKRKMK